MASRLKEQPTLPLPGCRFLHKWITENSEEGLRDPECRRRDRYSMKFDCLKTSLAARLVLGAVLGALLSSGTALALDPRKALSQYRVDVWKQRDGLPQDSVKAIVQTRDGYIWLGTVRGLARFDGVRFVEFNRRNTSEISDDEIITLLEDHEGSLWIGTYEGGILRYQNGKFTSYTTKDGLAHDSV